MATTWGTKEIPFRVSLDVVNGCEDNRVLEISLLAVVNCVIRELRAVGNWGFR